MNCLTPPEFELWAEKHHYILKLGLGALAAPRESLSFQLPTETNAVINTAKALSDQFAGSDVVLRVLQFNNAKGEEAIRLVTELREKNGERRSIEESPAMLFRSTESVLFSAILGLTFLYSWHVEAFSSSGKCLLAVNSDSGGVLSVHAESETLCAQLVQAGITVTVDS